MGSMSTILQWMSSNDFIAPQTIAPGLAFPFAAKASRTYPDYESTPSLPTFKTQSSSTPIRSMEISSSTGTSSSPLSGEQQESNKKVEVSSAHGGNSPRPYHEDFYKRPKKKPTSYNMSQKKLHSSCKQAQFKCKTPECNRSFKRHDHLKRHMKTHSKEKAHDC
ncbi:uncharacterized protein PFLUO_LOCUS5853 [Penicillium psychrofluorescens]|uniref:uncharacterized protein n=1 Tax=Penicillium psychrofluorescens TaxID=3158075 RepID=UPI003CCCD326